MKEGLVVVFCDDHLSAETEDYDRANGLFAEEYEGTVADEEGRKDDVVVHQS